MIPVYDNIPNRNVPIVVGSIIVVNVVAFLFELSLNDVQRAVLVHMLGIVPARDIGETWLGIHADDYVPFLTSMFLHGGWLHIVMNMWFLWLFGHSVENRMGAGRFLAFYLTCGLAAGIIYANLNAGSAEPMIGASGAIAGVLGAYFVLFPMAKLIVMFPIIFIPVFFELPAFLYLLFWFLLQYFSGELASTSLVHSARGGVAWWAHVGGFATGMILGPLFLLFRHPHQPPRRDQYGMKGAWSHYAGH